MPALSDKIADYVQNTFGKNVLDEYEIFINRPVNDYIRFNSINFNDAIIADLSVYGIILERVDGIPYAYKVLKGREKIGKTLEFVFGKYYIQSLSSMMPPIALLPNKNDVVCDLCAAPGSKTTQLSNLMDNKGILIANEVDLSRLKTLIHNIDKMNLFNISTINFKGDLLSKVFNEYFDKVLADVPCSGLGIVQKKGEVNNWWSIKHAQNLAELQYKILLSAIKMAKVGAEIVYSTCTLSIEENEKVINAILQKYPVEIVEITLPATTVKPLNEYQGESFDEQIMKAHRTFPWEVKSEGFFICKLRKIDRCDKSEKINIPSSDWKVVDSNNRIIAEHLKRTIDYYGIPDNTFDNFKFVLRGNSIYIVNSEFNVEQLGIFNRIGTKFGEIDKRNDLVLHSHAVQIFENEIKNNILTVEKLQAVEYLRGGSFSNTENRVGQQVIKYKKLVLGTAVALGTKMKSQLPKSKRSQEMIIE